MGWSISVPDTTAHAEAFHNILKRVYSNKRNRYMRTLLEKLMQIEEDLFTKLKLWFYTVLKKTFDDNTVKQEPAELITRCRM